MRPSAPLAVSVGDPCGIGIDVMLASWMKVQSGTLPPLPDFILLCDPDHLTDRISSMNLTIELADTTSQEALPTDKSKLPVLRLKHRLQGKPGLPQPQDAQGVLEAIETAVELVRTGAASAVVTLPINKKSLYDTGFDFPGHTEFLGSLAQRWPEVSNAVKPVMMLAGPQLRAVPVTIHIPLKDVPSSLTTTEIVDTATIVHDDLGNRFGIAAPRLAISGLNPHAGENGAMGKEDKEIIVPAIERLKRAGIACKGPLPADTMFHAAARETYDAAICMYHDQALIPAKALAFDETVNVTLGLPFVRTSPDHGTAFDIAGTGKADPTSFIAAMRMAADMAADSASGATEILA